MTPSSMAEHEQLLGENRALKLRVQEHAEQFQRATIERADRASAERSSIDATHAKMVADLSLIHI